MLTVCSPSLQRYYYYVTQGVPAADIAHMPEETMANVHARLLPKLVCNQEWAGVRQRLHEEVQQDYLQSVQKATVDYVLLDSSEMARLKIGSVPRGPPQRTIRAPVPWHTSLNAAREAQAAQLFTTNRVMAELQQLWQNKCVHCKCQLSHSCMSVTFTLTNNRYYSLIPVTVEVLFLHFFTEWLYWLQVFESTFC